MDAILDLVLAFIGRLAILLVSLGQWDVEPWISNESSWRAPAGALSYVKDGRRVVTFVGQQLAGLALVLGLIISAVVYASAV